MASIFASTLQIRDRIRKVDANRNCDQTFLFCQELKKMKKNETFSTIFKDCESSGTWQVPDGIKKQKLFFLAISMSINQA